MSQIEPSPPTTGARKEAETGHVAAGDGACKKAETGHLADHLITGDGDGRRNGDPRRVVVRDQHEVVHGVLPAGVATISILVAVVPVGETPWGPTH